MLLLQQMLKMMLKVQILALILLMFEKKLLYLQRELKTGGNYV